MHVNCAPVLLQNVPVFSFAAEIVGHGKVFLGQVPQGGSWVPGLHMLDWLDLVWKVVCACKPGQSPFCKGWERLGSDADGLARATVGIIMESG